MYLDLIGLIDVSFMHASGPESAGEEELNQDYPESPDKGRVSFIRFVNRHSFAYSSCLSFAARVLHI